MGEFRLGPEAEAYIKFSKGSYWVYKNTITLKLDTVRVNWYSSELLHFKSEKNDYYRENINVRWTGTISGFYDFKTLHPYVDLPPERLSKSVHHFALPCTKSGGTTSMIFLPIKKDGGGGVSGQTTTFNQLHDSLLVQNRWYYDVAEFEVDIDYTQNDWRGVYYWAKNIGLIKREKYTTFTSEYIEGWELTDYFIVQ